MYLQEIVSIITILSFIGTIVMFLFKSIVIKPLEKSIDALTETLKEFKLSTNQQLQIHKKEIDLLKLDVARHDVEIKSIKGGN